jgi:hypothetical protein
VGDTVGALLSDDDLATTLTGTDGYLVGDDDVLVGTYSGLNLGTSDFSVEAWVSTSVNADRTIVGKYAASGPRWRVTVTDDLGFEGRVRAEVDDGTTSVTAYGPSVRVDDDDWHHLVVVFDRDVGIFIYVDRIVKQTPAIVTGSVSNAHPFRIGGASNLPSFNGEIDEVAVFPHALAAGRVRIHFDAALGPPNPYLDETKGDAVGGYWRLGESALIPHPGGTAADATGNGLLGIYGTGTATGVPGALVEDSDTAASFTGIEGVSVSDTAALDFGTSDFTVEAWIKSAFNEERSIVSKIKAPLVEPYWVVSVTDDAGYVGRVRAKIFDGASTRIAYGPLPRVDDGAWHHVAVVFQRAWGIFIYVDGMEEGTSGTMTGDVSNSAPFRIGEADEYPTFRGEMDEVTITADSLSPYRLGLHYQAGSAPSVLPSDIEVTGLVEVDGVSEQAEAVDTVVNGAPGQQDLRIGGFHPGDQAVYDEEIASAWQEYQDSLGSPEPEVDDSAPGSGIEVLRNEPGNGAVGDAAPADTNGAIGRTRYVQSVNHQITAFRRQDLILACPPPDCDRGLSEFTFGQSGPFLIWDPRILWDRVTRRWYFAAIRLDDDPAKNYLVFGWSRTSSPTPFRSTPMTDASRPWCMYRIGPFTRWEDRPVLGQQRNFFIIGTNVYKNRQPPPPQYQLDLSRIWAFRKAALGVTRCAPAKNVMGWHWDFRSSDHPRTPLSPVPADTHAVTSNGYVVGTDRGTSKLAVWRISGSTVPRLADLEWIQVAAWDFPGTPVQPGGPRLFAGDGRITNAVADVDPTTQNQRVAVWLHQTVKGSRGRAVVRWYEILPGASANRIHQQGTVRSTVNFFFNAGIAVAYNGTDAVLHHNISGENTHIQVRAWGRRSSTPLGKWGSTFAMVANSAPNVYRDTTCDESGESPCVWGDYSTSAADPRQHRTIWSTNIYAGSPRPNNRPNWLTRNFSARPTAN